MQPFFEAGPLPLRLKPGFTKPYLFPLKVAIARSLHALQEA
jgi:hypothetical protein